MELRPSDRGGHDQIEEPGQESLPERDMDRIEAGNKRCELVVEGPQRATYRYEKSGRDTRQSLPHRENGAGDEHSGHRQPSITTQVITEEQVSDDRRGDNLEVEPQGNR